MKNIGYLVHPLIQTGAVVGIKMNVPVTGNIQLSVCVFEIMGGRQLIDVLEKCFGSRGILKCQVVLQSRLVKLLFEIGMYEKSLYFRAEHERTVHLGIVHGLDSEKVPCSEKLLFDGIPDDKGEHATKLAQKLFTVLLVSVEQHLGVGVGFEFVSRRKQFIADRPIVVNFSVEKENFGTVLVVDRLVSG